MKPINGDVVSTKSVSLAEAASILSAFISKGTGATREVSAYLARTCAAFDELVEYHQHVEKRSGQDETAMRPSRSVRRDYAEVKHESEQTDDHKMKKRKQREHEVELETPAGAARSNFNAMQLTNGAYDDDKTEDPGSRDRKKKKRKRDRQEEGGLSKAGEFEHPLKKKKAKGKVIEYEVEVERNSQYD